MLLRLLQTILNDDAADDLIEMSGLSAIDYFTELGANNKGLFYVYVIEKPNGQQSHMYFDFTRYFHHFLDAEFPFVWLGNEMIDKVIMPLSDHDFLYMYAAAQVEEAEGLYDEAWVEYVNISKAIKHLRIAAEKFSVDAHVLLGRILQDKGDIEQVALWLALCKHIEPECTFD